MPATEQTMYNQKLMHRVFAAAGVLLLGSTIWMFVADHVREWKEYQRTYRRIEMQMTSWREVQYQTDEARRKHDQLQRQFIAAQCTPLDQQLLDQFKQAVNQDRRLRAEMEGTQAEPFDFSALDKAVAEFGRAAAHAVDMRQKADQARGEAERAKEQATRAAGAAQQARQAVATAADRLQARQQAEQQEAEARRLAEEARRLADQADKADRVAKESEQQAVQLREQVLAHLQRIIDRARFREDFDERGRKFVTSKLDAKKAEYGLAVRDRREEVLGGLQAEIDALSRQRDVWSARYDSSKEHRQRLQRLLGELNQPVTEAQKALDESFAELERLEKANVQRRSTWFTSQPPFLGKRWLELPILDAFNSPLKIDNLWDEDNRIDYNFGRVRRFDRCTTCHRAIDKTMPGAATVPAYVKAQYLDFLLQTPAEEALPKPAEGPDGQPLPLTLEQVYGIRLAAEGQYLLGRNEVAISYVRPYSRDDPRPALGAQAILVGQAEGPGPVNGLKLRQAALQPPVPKKTQPVDQQPPGLLPGDVIVSVDGDVVRHRQDALQLLLTGRHKSDWGKPVRLRVRRGLPNPYVSHPRLDLFVGSMSPHKVSVFGCTICHEGQGSATEFKWASHSPNTPAQQQQWTEQYGWFDNPHWIYPMYPRRFAESGCLKCHHEVTELEPSSRFPDPPAPKLVEGYRLVRKYGCFGCHEINGYAGPHKRIGPDLRVEPNYYAAAQQLKLAPGTGYEKLTEEEKGWIEQLIYHPERDDVRRRVHQMIVDDRQAEQPRLSAYVHNTLEPLLRDVDVPGQERRAGPSLRFVGHKVTEAFLYDWVRNPRRFRPTTRMPRFFGQWNHLRGHSLELAQRYEPVEILGIVTYLLERTQRFDYIEPPPGISPSTRQERIERGKVLFQQRGCLACHSHQAFAEAEAFRSAGEVVQGPDLSGIAAKFGHPEGRKWLYSWLKDPTRYHVRTKMPNLLLDPIVEKDEQGKVTKVTDPAADIVEFLLSASTTDWQPAADNLTEQKLTQDTKLSQTLDEMVLMNLEESYSTRTAQRYLTEGIPPELAPELKGSERELLGNNMGVHKKLLYIGHRALSKYGCFGCHDIPGFEDAKPIGTSLADWGRKDPSRLAFNYIMQYLEEEQHGGATAEAGGSQAHEGMFSGQDLAFYRQMLAAGHRAGFIFQKLREPRSFDYRDVDNKRYNEQLRMPQFPLNDVQREAIITFVLGLVSDPPAPKFLYQPNARQQAIAQGRQVLEKYNCGGCHMLQLEKWRVAYPPGTFGAANTPAMFPFLDPGFTPDQLAAANQPDRRGLLHATLVGLPAVDNNDGLPLLDGEFEGELEPLDPETDYDPAKLVRYFDLYQPAVLDGEVRHVGVQTLRIPERLIEERYPSEGGFLARYLLPHVVQWDRQRGAGQARGKEAWGWLPPPLFDEGEKVQSAWLHQFLLDPHPIRPQVVLRMPRFNMSSEEATQLVDYFAATSGAEYPYQFNQRRQPAHLALKELQYRQLLAQQFPDHPPEGSRFDHAMKIVVDKKNGCVQCHILGDFQQDPKGPNLELVYRRLQPGYVRRWLARPASILPYTSMPDNFKYLPDEPERDGFVVPQPDGSVIKYVYGTSTQQLDAVVDLLMNFDSYTLQRSSMRQLVEASGAAAGQPASEQGSDAGSGAR